MSDPLWWGRVIDAVAAFRDEHSDNLPGAVIAVDTREDGPLIASVGDGWSTDTICEIGTMTKALTGTAVLLALEDSGLMDVDTEVWRLPGMEAYADGGSRQRIRVRHLLQHTSGLPTIRHYSEGPASPCNDPQGPPPFFADASTALGPTSAWTCYPGGTNEYVYARGRCQPARTLTVDEVSRFMMETYAPESEPGETYVYSPTNYVVAARIAEQLTGKSVNVYLKQRLFDPLGMVDSFFVAQPTGDPATDARIDEGVTAEQRRRIADVTLITRDGEMPPEVAPGPEGRWDKYRRGWRFVFPDGGMYTTAGDLLTFLRALRDGAPDVLSPRIVDLLVDDGGHGHTMGFGYRRKPTPYGQGADTLEQLGSKMTYCWLELRRERPLIGVFLSQRLPNISVTPNMFSGMGVIFKVFVPAVAAAVRGVEGAAVR